ncbi:class I SAM-dependent methyltransferase [Pseudonocardia adelaidensis]|uniref:class I SAM-dependent methyltransferase n=1 Tax=Pseudonocardia adelaidensis TaxID=648754 RepID=UPI0031EDA179
MPATETRWNHNIHYHPFVLAAVPPGSRAALDVGCGEGLLTKELSAVVPSVIGIDRDRPVLERAKSHARGPGIEYLQANILTHPFEPESFDVVASIAALHHMDTAAGLERMRDLLRPGGVLAVVGLPRSRWPHDLPYAVAGVVAHRWLRWRRGGESEMSAPTVWPPPDTFAQVRATAERLLPGVRMRRHVLFRYSLLWTKPATAGRG